MDPVFVLIPSPLVGASTWSPVAQSLRRLEVETLVPTLVDDDDRGQPYWQQHAAAAIGAVAQIPRGVPLVLVGHSGAGPLLPAVGQRIAHPITAYLFVDAGIPIDGASRLELMEMEDPAHARWFRQYMAAGGRFPAWTDEDLAPILPEPHLRRRLLSELRPRPLAFFQEPIPVFPGWPDAPCGYLQLSPAYDVPARRAREAGWRTREIGESHFHLLLDPPAVAEALLDLVAHQDDEET